MLKKVSTKEIENIKKRLKSELGDKFLSFQRRQEINSLLNYLTTWLEWKDYQERKHYKEVIKSES